MRKHALLISAIALSFCGAHWLFISIKNIIHIIKTISELGELVAIGFLVSDSFLALFTLFALTIVWYCVAKYSKFEKMTYEEFKERMQAKKAAREAEQKSKRMASLERELAALKAEQEESTE